MTAWTISLRALRHPLTLISIGLLLLNDHVLKAATPSVVTGKVSDFAGLFFFPFLLAAIFGLLFDRLRLPPRDAAALAFGTTLVWFMLIKTWLPANALTARLITQFVGLPVHFALDPTDLVALIVLLPAWRLWRQSEFPHTLHSPGRLAYLALGVASLATLATSCPTPMSLSRLVVYEQSIYVGDSYANYGFDAFVGVSQDGIDWQSTASSKIPENVLLQLKQPVSLPVIQCEAESRLRCYRITGAELVESSADGGDTWQIDWQIPWGRKEFMLRYPSFPCGKGDLNTTPNDLALLHGQNGDTVVVAMGNEGILTRTPDGSWQRIGIGNAQPTPYSETSLDRLFTVILFMVLGETALPLSAAVLAWVGYSLWAAQMLLAPKAPSGGKSVNWVMAPTLWGIAVLVGGIALAWFFVRLSGANEELFFLPLAFGAIGFLFGPFITWDRIADLSKLPGLTRQAQTIVIFSTIGLFPLAWLPFVAWVYAVIPVYSLALSIALAIGGFSLLGGVIGLRWITKRARMLQRAARQAAPDDQSQEVAPAEAAASPPAAVTPRREWVVFGILWALATSFGSVIPTLASLLLFFSRSILPFLTSTPLMLAAHAALFGLAGWAGMRLARRANLPAILSPRITTVTSWIVLLLAGGAFGAVSGLIVRLVVYDHSLGWRTNLNTWLYSAGAMIGAEIVFRLFLLSALILLIVPRLQDRLGKTGSLWVSIALAALISTLATAPWLYYHDGAALAFWGRRVYCFLLALLAGRQFTRDGLSGAICLSIGAELAWQIILKDVGYSF